MDSSYLAAYAVITGIAIQKLFTVAFLLIEHSHKGANLFYRLSVFAIIPAGMAAILLCATAYVKLKTLLYIVPYLSVINSFSGHCMICTVYALIVLRLRIFYRVYHHTTYISENL